MNNQWWWNAFKYNFWVDMRKFQLIPFHVGGSCMAVSLSREHQDGSPATTTSPSQISTRRTEMSTDPQATWTCLITSICNYTRDNLKFKSKILTSNFSKTIKNHDTGLQYDGNIQSQKITWLQKMTKILDALEAL